MTEPKIQILSLREFVTNAGEVKLHDRMHYPKNWRADSIEDLFTNIDAYVSAIPADERWNMFYTAAECIDGEKPRNFVQQNIVPFDIDGIDLTQTEKYLEVFERITGLDIEKCAVVLTGNGIHIIVLMDKYFENPSYFDITRGHYKALCGKLNTTLFEEGLLGEFDHSVFSNRRLLRLPNTENRKKLKGNHMATLLRNTLQPQSINLTELSGLPDLMEADHINTRAYNRMPKPDTQAVQEGCAFIQHAFENQDSISEPEWYAMLSIVGRLDNGMDLVHKYSERHPSYNYSSTDVKAKQAIDASGPRTCDNISGYFKGCMECPHRGQIRSPISIRGKDYVKTKDTGFWNIVITQSGEVKRTTPNFDDLVTHYDTQHLHVVIRETELVYNWTGKYWKQQERIDLNAFMESVMEPKPNKNHCAEFVSKMQRTNVKDTHWLVVENKINLNNGVLDTKTMAFEPHNKLYGFPYILPFDYVAEATCPRWIQFIEEVTVGEQELIDVLQEYMGLCLGFVDPTFVQKAAILLGTGANGKSVYLNVLKNLLGSLNYSVVPLQEAANNRTARVGLVNKMANITEETPRGAFMDSSFFKDIVSGGEIEAHKMYHGPFKFKNTAKIIMACNELPEITDMTNGMKRRLLVIPFRRTFQRMEQDPLLHVKLEQESSGIFNWALQGLQRLQKNHYRFSDGPLITAVVQKAMEDSNPLFDWAQENLTIVYGHEGTPFKELFEDYQMYSGERNVSKIKFSKAIKAFVGGQIGDPSMDTIVRKVGERNTSIRYVPHVVIRNDDDTTNTNY